MRVLSKRPLVSRASLRQVSSGRKSFLLQKPYKQVFRASLATLSVVSAGNFRFGLETGEVSSGASCELYYAIPIDDSESGELRTISLEEIRKHNGEDSLWVVFQGYVYDVTPFIKLHPGGKEALLRAGGQDLSVFWEKYQVHYKDYSLATLEKYKIGKISDADAETLLALTTSENIAYQDGERRNLPGTVYKAKRRAFKRTLKICLVVASVPLLLCVRWIFRVFGFVFGLGKQADRYIPVSVPGYWGAAPITKEDKKNTRVAIIGGGIGGCGCAYSLQKSGFDVTLYEAREKLGGNAQTADFPVKGNKDVTHVTQDLSVLYWAPEYYRNYVQLLETFDARPQVIEVPYVLKTNVQGYDEYYTPPGTELFDCFQPSLMSRFEADFKKYDKMIRTVKRINSFFSSKSDPVPTFYKSSVLNAFNPLNFISLRRMAKLSGISEDFYQQVLLPFQGFQFSSYYIDDLPAVALDVLDDIVPLTKSRKHMSWGLGNSTVIFQKATQDCNVKLHTRVLKVEYKNGKKVVIDSKGNEETYDKVVFACPAGAVGNILQDSNCIESTLLEGVSYHDDYHRRDWADWLEVPIHQDASIFPEKYREIITKKVAFYVDVDVNAIETSPEYHHSLGSWSPPAKALGASGAPMFLSQCVRRDRDIDPKKTIGTFSPPKGHATLCTANIALTQLFRFIQGRRGMYYCSHYTAPGNGHDLALLSGLACAKAIGADYPFKDEEAQKDYVSMCKF
eukprot:CAMPEP_0174273874 /NCGR_PEP_ID=MMETSP0439-20130205/56096_1 /TAXON_ID=0 /ORGANISM="Stereomyxa ramosa, Strain Chinc5" /LENGTH=734 /DNA_ID=CAMNT_0015365321 /DNA_START=174 /DNA_END=2375 /DNA_ORIENTATION=-